MIRGRLCTLREVNGGTRRLDKARIDEQTKRRTRRSRSRRKNQRLAPLTPSYAHKNPTCELKISIERPSGPPVTAPQLPLQPSLFGFIYLDPRLCSRRCPLSKTKSFRPLLLDVSAAEMVSEPPPTPKRDGKPTIKEASTAETPSIPASMPAKERDTESPVAGQKRKRISGMSLPHSRWN
jgi:hypothetical protein